MVQCTTSYVAKASVLHRHLYLHLRPPMDARWEIPRIAHALILHHHKRSMGYPRAVLDGCIGWPILAHVFRSGSLSCINTAKHQDTSWKTSHRRRFQFMYPTTRAVQNRDLKHEMMFVVLVMTGEGMVADRRTCNIHYRYAAICILPSPA